MPSTRLLEPVPWDEAVFSLPSWHVLEYSEAALCEARDTVGHHTIKVDPLESKERLHQHGFYYCDTLLEPWCSSARLRPARDPRARVAKEFDVESILRICEGAFVHGRFHRDFSVAKKNADSRYVRWLKNLAAEGRVFGLFWDDICAGFLAHQAETLVLHAVAPSHRGRGLAKFWWSEICLMLLESGAREVKSSVSASNVAVLNLYASLGFSFRNPCDVYHLAVHKKEAGK